MNVKIRFISGPIILLAFAVFFFSYYRDPGPLTCATRSNLHLGSQSPGLKIDGEVLTVFHISSTSEGRLSQVGSITVEGKKYTVDRNVALHFINKDRDGYLQTQRLAIVKNKNDTLPDEFAELLMSRQEIFYYKIMHITDNIYGIRDLRRTLMVCRAR